MQNTLPIKKYIVGMDPCYVNTKFYITYNPRPLKVVSRNMSYIERDIEYTLWANKRIPTTISSDSYNKGLVRAQINYMMSMTDIRKAFEVFDKKYEYDIRSGI